MKTAIVLGCGPAGLLAAHAARRSGYAVRVISKKRRSEMFGAQYLHDYIPGLELGVAAKINYRLDGTLDGYRQKVYGENWAGIVSPDEFGQEEPHYAYDIRKAYEHLWYDWVDKIEDHNFKGGLDVQDFVGPLGRTDAVIFSTLPAPMLCVKRDEHVFRTQPVWAISDAPERGIFCPVKAAQENEVLCNGHKDTSWYRNAFIFGYRTCEWPENRRPPFDGVANVLKPLSTTCSCQLNIIRLGRYGKWQKGVLAHTAYHDVREMLMEPLEEVQPQAWGSPDA